MKILKSGIEMTPEEFRESRGGIKCACGCEGGYNSATLWESADEGSDCQCGCTSGPDTWLSRNIVHEIIPTRILAIFDIFHIVKYS